MDLDQRYELGDELEHGDGVRVLRAFDRKLGRAVAIKVADGDDDREARRHRLEREASILADLHHPAIVTVHDTGTDRDGRPFVAMRMLDGPTLADMIAGAPGSAERLGLLRVVVTVAGAIAYAHRRGVVHGRLRPASVVVGEGGDTVIDDWSLARRVDEGADVGDDIHALGEILHELVAGARPSQGLAAIADKAMARGVEDRYRDVGELVDDLRRHQGGRHAAHRLWVPMAVALGLVVVAGAVFVRSRSSAASSEQICRDADAPVRSRWNPDIATGLETAFAATGLDYALATFVAIRRGLDDHTAQVAAMRIEACVAHARGQQAGPVLDLRMTCLDRRIGQLDALLSVLSTPDARVIAVAPGLVAALPRVSDCADLELLSRVTPLPDDPAERDRIAAIRARLDAVSVSMNAGKIIELDELDAVVAEARAAVYPPLTALALARASSHRYTRGDRVRAEKELRESILLAESSGDDRVRLRATTLLFGQVGKDRSRDAESLALLAHAEALAQRIHATEDLAELRSKHSEFLRDRDQLDAAIARAREAVDGLAAMPDPSPSSLGQAHFHLAAALTMARRTDEALAQWDLAEVNRRKVNGEIHINNVGVIDGRASALLYAERPAEALVLYQRALAIHERIAPKSQSAAGTLLNIGNTLNMLDREREAIEVLERGRRLVEEIYSHDHPLYVSFLRELGSAHRYLLEHDAALTYTSEALAISNRIVGEADPSSIGLRFLVAEILRVTGRTEEAVAEYRRTIALMDRNPEPHVERGWTLSGLGEALGELGRWREAVAVLEEAVPLVERRSDSSALAATRFRLAQALVGAGGDRDRAIALAVIARAGFAANQDSASVRQRSVVDAWLAKHDRGAGARGER